MTAIFIITVLLYIVCTCRQTSKLSAKLWAFPLSSHRLNNRSLTGPCIEQSLRYHFRQTITHLFQNISNPTRKIAVVTNALEGIMSLG
jgi:hypothetical protein